MAMGNASAIAQQIMQNGNSYIPVGQNNNQNEWQKMLAMLATADKMDAGTMAGFGLGKLLRDGFDTWKENYDARGFINDKLLDSTPEEREAILQRLQQNNPKQYDRVMKNAMKKGYSWAGGNSVQDTNQPNYDFNPQKYNMLEYIKRMGWNR